MSKVFYTERSAALRLSGVNNALREDVMSKSTSSSRRAVLAGAVTIVLQPGFETLGWAYSSGQL